ncbi:MAG: outer membrane beta-barrel protein [Ignavibacteriales bacterium]|nr:outer membrane beta-barrel protein [Ignavibacteriales bacterium]
MKKLTSQIGLVVLLGILLVSFGQSQLRSGKFGIGLGGSGYILITDDKGTDLKTLEAAPKFGGGLGVSWSVMEHLGVRANFAGGQIGWKENGTDYISMLLSGNFYVSGDLLPHDTFNPFVFAGVGALYYDPRGPDLLTPSEDKIDIVYSGGVGFDFFLSEFMSVTASGEYVITNTDKLDGRKSGGANDSFVRAGLEFRYYFFDQDFITKLLEAMRGKK